MVLYESSDFIAELIYVIAYLNVFISKNYVIFLTKYFK